MSMMSYSNEEFSYEFGMNGQLKDDEVFEGAYSAEYWMYDSRLGRRWNIDPRPNPSISVYACFANNPIWFSDVYGDSAVGSSAPTQAEVQKGDGPYQFAKRNDITPEQLIEWNKDVFPEGFTKGTWIIHPGQKLNTSDPNLPTASFSDLETNVGSVHFGVSDEELKNFLNDAGNVVGFFSFSAGAVEHLGGLEEASKLLKSGQFEAMWMKETKQWKLTFHGNKSVPAEFVQFSRSTFIAKVTANAQNARLLNVVKSGGMIFSVAGGVISAAQFAHGDIGAVEFGADMVFTYVALRGGYPGWIASSVYFGGKFIIKEGHELKSDYGGYDISNQQMKRNPHMVPKK